MKWVTWENIGVDRIACGWLIRRFIDPVAEIVFIPMNTLPLPDDAEAFDIPGVRLSHHHGHCTFYSMIDSYQLKDPVLHRMARIIDEADIVQEITLEPSAPGLDLICRGIRLTSQNDLAALERGRLIYDAVYAQLSALSG